MAQEIVPAREVTAPAEVTLQFKDADLICAKLNVALTARYSPPPVYSEDARSLFQLAWAVATYRRNAQVTVFHLAYAVVCDSPEDGQHLAEYLKCEPEALADGCILLTSQLRESTGDAEILPLAVGTERWLYRAFELARENDGASELTRHDLVQAVLTGRLDDRERSYLRKAARTGTRHRVASLAPKRLPSVATPEEIIRHFEEVEKGPVFPGGDFANLVEQFEEFEERYGVDSDHHKQALTRIEGAIENCLATIGPPTVPFDNVVRRLATIDQRVLALGAQIPRPPSSARLATAIVGVIMVGAAAGLALTHWQPGSKVLQAVADSAK